MYIYTYIYVSIPANGYEHHHQDTHVLVRKHALVLLTQLILQDYIKWRGLLLFRFLSTAVDRDEEMADFSKTVLKKTLNIKYPDFFAVHFSECILVINGCTDHPVVRTCTFIM
jgi:condensin-2 complex subunit D3